MWSNKKTRVREHMYVDVQGCCGLMVGAALGCRLKRRAKTKMVKRDTPFFSFLLLSWLIGFGVSCAW